MIIKTFIMTNHRLIKASIMNGHLLTVKASIMNGHLRTVKAFVVYQLLLHQAVKAFILIILSLCLQQMRATLLMCPAVKVFIMTLHRLIKTYIMTNRRLIKASIINGHLRTVKAFVVHQLLMHQAVKAFIMIILILCLHQMRPTLMALIMTHHRCQRLHILMEVIGRS